MATATSKFGDVAFSWQTNDKGIQHFTVSLAYLPSDNKPSAEEVTIKKETLKTEITVDIPTKFADDTLALPITGPALIDDRGLIERLALQFAVTTSPAGCNVNNATASGLLLESSVRITIKQDHADCDTNQPGDDFETFWTAFKAAAVSAFEGGSATIDVLKMGCHQKAGTKMTCFGGFKVPANAESTDAFIKVFKASDTVTEATPTKGGPVRKAGSALAPRSTATCNFTWDKTALQYKVTYTNKNNDDEAICIFMVENNKATQVDQYTYSETDPILLTKANKSYADDDLAGKLAFSSGYVNSSWSILTIILIVGGLLIIVVLGLFWWFRTPQVESEEEE